MLRTHDLSATFKKSTHTLDAKQNVLIVKDIVDDENDVSTIIN